MADEPTPITDEAAPASAAVDSSIDTTKPAAPVENNIMAEVMSNLQSKGQLPQSTPATDTQVTPSTDAPAKADAEASTATPKPEAATSDDAGKSSVQKRIDKLTFEKKEAEEQHAEAVTTFEARITQLESELAERSAEPNATAPATGPYNLDTIEAVHSERERLEEAKDMLDDYKTTGWEGVDAKGEPAEYSPEQIRAQLATVREQLRALPAVERTLKQRNEKIRPLITERYDWWGNAKDPRHVEAQAQLKQFPELRRAPNYELIIANHVAMEHQVKEAAKAPAQPVVKAPAPAAPRSDDPPPVPSTATAASTTRAPAGRQLNEADLKNVRSGDKAALTGLVANLLARK